MRGGLWAVILERAWTNLYELWTGHTFILNSPLIFADMSTPSAQQNQSLNDGRNAFPFERRNYIFFLLGIALLIVGYLLMSGGGVEDPNEFSEAIFSTRRITIAPLTVLAGYGVIFYSILKRFPAEGAKA